MRLALALTLLSSPALATGLEIDVAGEASGTIVVDLFDDVAPNHVAQIVALANDDAYDGAALPAGTGGAVTVVRPAATSYPIPPLDLRIPGPPARPRTTPAALATPGSDRQEGGL